MIADVSYFYYDNILAMNSCIVASQQSITKCLCAISNVSWIWLRWCKSTAWFSHSSFVLNFPNHNWKVHVMWVKLHVEERGDWLLDYVLCFDWRIYQLRKSCYRLQMIILSIGSWKKPVNSWQCANRLHCAPQCFLIILTTLTTLASSLPLKLTWILSMKPLV